MNGSSELTPITSTSTASAVKGDVFRRVLVYLNHTEFETKFRSNADKLTTAVVQLLARIRADQADITTYVLAKQ
jgi:hypothetical protein